MVRVMSDPIGAVHSNAASSSLMFQSVPVALKHLYLDPNNYRFIDASEYTKVERRNLFDDKIQKRTTSLILGDNQENVKDLIDSFRKNNWLPVDQVQAQKIADDRYLVVEGNRRVATLKFLEQQYRERSIDLGNLDPTIFDNVPVVIYPDADEAHHLIVMGLKHISGPKKWPTINQAQLIKTLHEKHAMAPEDICKSLGISRREFNLTQRTLVIVDLYKKSEYGEQFTSNQYNVFREVVNMPALRDWIEWDESKWAVRNVKQLNRLFPLVSTVIVSDTDENADNEPLEREPAITTGAQMREMGRIVTDPEALEILEKTRSLSQAMLGAATLPKNQIKHSLEVLKDAADTLTKHAALTNDADTAKAIEIGRKLLSVPAVKHGKWTISVDDDAEREPMHLVFSDQFQPFSTLEITDYKVHKQLRLENLGRINIFAGPNNSGKTSVLEAIYLLTQQCESRSLMDVVARRGKLGKDAPPKLLFQLIPEKIELAGDFDRLRVQLRIDTDKDNEAITDKNGYVGSILMKSSYSTYHQTSETHLFDKREPQRFYAKPRVLCRSLLSSPFSMHDPAVLARVHEKAVERGAKQRVIDFITKWVDSGLRNIELVNEFRRFWVSHDDPSRNLDLTHFGEGMQRVFMIGLLFAHAEHGVVLIDEIENALHTSLLQDFSRFLHELAIEFNVQVFLTSHSKECIDAFVLNEFKLDEVSAYVLVQRNGKTACIHRSGSQLAELLEISNVDIRRAR